MAIWRVANFSVYCCGLLAKIGFVLGVVHTACACVASTAPPPQLSRLQIFSLSPTVVALLVSYSKTHDLVFGVDDGFFECKECHGPPLLDPDHDCASFGP